MPKFNRDYYLKLIETDYFGSVMAAKMDAVLACFTPAAEVNIYHGDNPIRRFFAKPGKDQESFTVFWGHLFENYHAHFGNFHHVIDTEHDCAASTFLPTLTPKPGSAYLAAGILTLNNCNFFRFKDGKIDHMIIYYANPTLGAKLGAASSGPTAFPKG
ncbi:MAG: nuclear transport factor 2 family protein [Rhodospirillaceae bacterium]|nr:nuclear transport factor 2 family protein [Rhodospirillaceae bacterium]